jgi:hypothetical protein
MFRNFVQYELSWNKNKHILKLSTRKDLTHESAIPVEETRKIAKGLRKKKDRDT